METIRYGSFETNSSSTHAIVIPKKVHSGEWSLYDSLDHNYCFGREESRLVFYWDEKLAYVWLLLQSRMDNKDDEYYTVTEKDMKHFKKQVNKAFKEIKQRGKSVEITPNHLFKYLEDNRTDGNITGDDMCCVLREDVDNYVDHAYGFQNDNFIKRILDDYEFMKRFIFNNDSYITVGSDEHRGYNIKTIGFEYDYNDYDEDNSFWDKLNDYEEDNDVYLKGE